MNNLTLVQEIQTLLLQHNLDTYVAGGWAEEIHKIIAPREHGDIDLALKANSFVDLDKFLNQISLAQNCLKSTSATNAHSCTKR